MDELVRLGSVVAVCREHGTIISDGCLALAEAVAERGKRWQLAVSLAQTASVGVTIEPERDDERAWRIRVFTCQGQRSMVASEAVEFARHVERAVDLHGRIAVALLGDDEAHAIGRFVAREEFGKGSRKPFPEASARWTVARAIKAGTAVPTDKPFAARIVGVAATAFNAELARLCAMPETEALEVAERRFGREAT